MADDHEQLASFARRAKREQDAIVWSVAIVSPGLLGALSQVDKLFGATRFPEVFGYVFGAMECLFIVSIILGVRAYNGLQIIVAMQEVYSQDGWLLERQKRDLAEEHTRSPRNPERIKNLEDRIGKLFDARAGNLDFLGELTSPWTKLPLHQRALASYGYMAFVVIILTSDFSRLIQH